MKTAEVNSILKVLPADLAATLRAEYKRAKRNAARRARDEAMRDIGLVKVRGASGRVYWE